MNIMDKIITPEVVDQVKELVKEFGGKLGEMKHEATPYDTAMLIALQRKPHIYGGTVPYEVVQVRRAKNRLARKARRINR